MKTRFLTTALLLALALLQPRSVLRAQQTPAIAAQAGLHHHATSTHPDTVPIPVCIDPRTKKAHPKLFAAEETLRRCKAEGNLLGYGKAAADCGELCLQISLVNKGLAYYRLAHHLAIETAHENLRAFATRGIGHALWYGGHFVQAVDTMLSALQQYRRLRQQWFYADGIMVISSIYSDMGNYERAFEAARQSLAHSKETDDVRNLILSLVQLGYLYRNVGDHTTAMDYFQQAFALNPPKEEWCYRHLCNRTGDLYTERKMFDSAYHFYSQSLQSHAESKTSLLRMADYWLARKDYNKAKEYYATVYRQLNGTGEGNLLVFSLIGLGKIAAATGAFETAVRYGREALQIANPVEAKLTLRDAYGLLAAAYDSLHLADSAFHYYKKFVAKKDAVLSDQFKGKIYAYRQTAQLQLLTSEKKLAEQELAVNRQLRNAMAVGILLLLLTGAFVFRNVLLKRKNEALRAAQVQAALRQRAADMEMQALRAQMNPHFIFNALSSVNRFILKNDTDKASDYLTRFSRLIRLVLVNAQRDLITLEEEIEMLRLYLQIEQVRFRNAFQFSINTAASINPETVALPPMLLQPFCENAVWHGLMHRESGGELRIEFSATEKGLRCIVTDNGIGRQRAAELGSKSAEKIKSLGGQLIKERLALLGDETHHSSFTVVDVTDESGAVCGTRVRLDLPLQTLPSTRKKQPHAERIDC